MQLEPTITFCYLLLLPAPQGLETKYAGKELSRPKDAPYFFDLDIDYSELKSHRIEIDGVNILIEPQILDNQVWVAQCTYSLGKLSLQELTLKKQQINKSLRAQLLLETEYRGSLIEEYLVVLLGAFEELPEDYIKRHGFLLARLLRNSEKPITKEQSNLIMKSRVSYSTNDLTIVDWESALVFAQGNDFQSDIDLLKVGNYQLLRYRMLDDAIEKDLRSLHMLLKKRGLRWPPLGATTLLMIIQNRLELLLDFERTKQSLLLIGEWYTTQLYQIIVDEFYIDEWEKIVNTKLDSLSDIDETMRQNLTFSWSRIIDFIQVGGWGILLIGYFVLFFIDLARAK